MKRASIAGGAFAIVLVLLALAVGYRVLHRDLDPAAVVAPAIPPPIPPAAAETHAEAEIYQGFL